MNSELRVDLVDQFKAQADLKKAEMSLAEKKNPDAQHQGPEPAGDEACDGSLGELRRSEVDGPLCKRPLWVGTPGQTINSFADLAVGIQRMDDKAIPSDDRCCVLSPADYWGLLGSQTALYINEAAKGAYREGSLGMIGGVDTNMAQNVPNHTVGSDGAGTVGAAITAGTISYDDVKDTDQQTITSSSWTPNVGDVFTIGVVGTGVHDVNPITKARLPFLKQFRVVSGSSNTWVISPALIWNGAFQNMESVGQTDLNSLALTASVRLHCLPAEHALPPQCLRSCVGADGEACRCG